MLKEAFILRLFHFVLDVWTALYRTTCVSWHRSQKQDDFVEAQFCYLHALADGN